MIFFLFLRNWNSSLRLYPWPKNFKYLWHTSGFSMIMQQGDVLFLGEIPARRIENKIYFGVNNYDINVASPRTCKRSKFPFFFYFFVPKKVWNLRKKWGGNSDQFAYFSQFSPFLFSYRNKSGLVQLFWWLISSKFYPIFFSLISCQ